MNCNRCKYYQQRAIDETPHCHYGYREYAPCEYMEYIKPIWVTGAKAPESPKANKGGCRAVTKFRYYEEGKEKILPMRKVYRLFITSVDDNQKSQGTTFTDWISEMEHMGILNR